MSNFSTLIRENLPADYLDVVLEAARLADQSRQGTVLVGGVVRDLILGQRILEVDLMLDPPVRPIVEELARMTNAKVVAHDVFHTFSLHLGFGSKLDVVTAREETYRAPASLPDVFPSTIPLDLKRRDFTVNAMAFWLNKDKFGELLDPFNGKSDVEGKLIRVMHHLSFVDDPTRIFRAARFSGRFNFNLEPETEKVLYKTIESGVPLRLSPVRRRHEFESILKEDDPIPAFKLLQKWGALKCLHPEWELRLEHMHTVSSSPSLSGSSLLIHRLREWFRPWGKDMAKLMMTELAFEKKIKNEVTAELL